MSASSSLRGLDISRGRLNCAGIGNIRADVQQASMNGLPGRPKRRVFSMSTPPPVWPPQPGSPSPYGAPQSSSNCHADFSAGHPVSICLPSRSFLDPIAWILGNNALKTGMVAACPGGPESMHGPHLRHYRHGLWECVIGIIGWIVVFFATVRAGAALHHPGAFPQPTPAPTSSP